jgi:hypothetical protein
MPLLLLFSPFGDGAGAVRVFQGAAEELGVVLMASNDSRNGPLRPALRAQEALWTEAMARFAPPEGACFAAGFSGGARMALRLARSRTRLRGVACLGAFGDGRPGLLGLGGKAFVLAGGREDFSHWELLEGRQELASRGRRAWAERYAGGHRWPDPGAARCLLQALLGEAGLLSPEAWQAFLGESAVRAEALAREGHLLEAVRLWRELELRGLAGAGVAARALEARAEVRKELEEERAFGHLRLELSGHRGSEAWEAVLARLAREAAGSAPGALQARRVLEGECLVLELAAEAARAAGDPARAERLEALRLGLGKER